MYENILVLDYNTVINNMNTTLVDLNSSSTHKLGVKT